MVAVQKVKLSQIEPNRYRHVESYPLGEEKIARLLDSYEASGFWDGSIQGRPHPKKKGKVEIAFGHHRIEAARRAGMKEVGIVVGERSDADMLRMMADENAEEFKHDPTVTSATIGAVIEAYGRGEIELEPVPEGQHGKGPQTGVYEVTFPGGKVSRRYTLLTVARFLRWTKAEGSQATRACEEALRLWHASNEIKEAVSSLPPDKKSSVAAEAIQGAANVAAKAAKAAKLTPGQASKAVSAAIKDATKQIIKESSGYEVSKKAQEIGKKAVATVAPKKEQKLPTIQVFAEKVMYACSKADPFHDIIERCSSLLPYLDDLGKPMAEALAESLRKMRERESAKLYHIEEAIRVGKKAHLRKLIEAALEPQKG